MDDLAKDRLLFTDLDDTYILIEFQVIVSRKCRIFSINFDKGKIPIVHPERNAGFIKEPNRLIEFLDMDVYSTHCTKLCGKIW